MWHRAIGSRPVAVWWTSFCLIGLLAISVTPRPARAFQDDEDAARPARAAAPREIDDVEAVRRGNESSAFWFYWMIRSSGVFGFLIVLLAFVMAALILILVMQLQRDNYLPAATLAHLEQQLDARDFQGAFETAKASDSLLGRVVAAGLGRLRDGYDAAEAGMQEVGDEDALAMEQKIGYLSLIASVGPLLGLLGTVQGLAMNFQVLATATTSRRPDLLVNGFATALFTTLEGLIVAIPAMTFYMVFKNRLARFLLETGHAVDNLMIRFKRLDKSPGPTRTASPTLAASPDAHP